MPVISAADQVLDDEVYVDLRHSLGVNLRLKCEGFNFAGSVKLRAAVALVEAAARNGQIGPRTTLVESSSGNLGVALSVVAAARSLDFVCVTDPKCNPATVKMIRRLGSKVIVVDRPDAIGGYLAARKALVRELCEREPDYVWLNQYENPANWLAHYEATAPLIAKRFPALDVLFVGVGTGGTLAGCARYFGDNHPDVRVVAVDSVGSVNFGRPAGARHIPGLGAGEQMPFTEQAPVHDVVSVPEPETVRMCRRLAARGFLFGGSTGTVVSGAAQWLARHDPAQRLTAVAIAPDLGERYLDTVYDDSWLAEHYPDLEDPSDFTTGDRP